MGILLWWLIWVRGIGGGGDALVSCCDNCTATHGIPGSRNPRIQHARHPHKWAGHLFPLWGP